MYLLGFPLLLIPFAIYHILAFLLGMTMHEVAGRIPMLSGATFELTVGDLLVGLGILLLYVEILKSTRLSSRAITDHLLSLALFVAMLVEFLLVERVVTSTFFLLLMLSLVDVIGGFSVTIRTAQRDLAVEGMDRLSGG
jgi:hypothetical protein